MNETSLREALAQAPEAEAVEIFQQTLRRSVRLALYAAMEAEVNELCGAKYHPNGSDRRRAGSEQGSAYLDGRKEPITRPRVRDVEGEVVLEVYRAASSQQHLFDEVVANLEQGLSQRGASRTKPGSLGKSAASRMWTTKSREQLELLRARDISATDFIALMIDGIRLADGIWVIVALGIDMDGKKTMLDFGEGSSETATAVSGLITRLKQRGINGDEARRLLVVRDGSAAIKKAIDKHWPKAVQQECLVHMQRHTRDKLRRRDRADFDIHCKNLRHAQGKEAGEEAFDDLIDFLSERNAAAAIALSGRRDYLLGFHRLEVSSTLNVTFLSTNCIENAIANWREATGNVKRWRTEKDMVSRWTASGMLWAESGFRKIRHAGDLPELAAALAVSAPAPQDADAPCSTSTEPASAAGKSHCTQTSK